MAVVTLRMGGPSPGARFDQDADVGAVVGCPMPLVVGGLPVGEGQVLDAQIVAGDLHLTVECPQWLASAQGLVLDGEHRDGRMFAAGAGLPPASDLLGPPPFELTGRERWVAAMIVLRGRRGLREAGVSAAEVGALAAKLDAMSELDEEGARA